MPVETDFVETLPLRGRALVRRLESFGDIVFGFSISELALQLGLPKHASDLFEDPFRYAFFFGTFAIIAIMWLRFHRMLSMAFAPGRIDLTCAFTYLSFVALLPYALYTFSVVHVRADAQYVVLAYVICLLGTSLSSIVLSLRAIGRSSGILPEIERARLRQRASIESVAIVLFAGVLAVNFTIGPTYSGCVMFVMPIAVRVIRRRFPAPGWHAVHVRGTGATHVD